MKAITVISPSGPAIVEERSLPVLRQGYLLVKTICVACNPVDHLVMDYNFATPGGLLGCDYAGEVIAIGEGVRRSFKVGDRVCGCTRPSDPDEHENGTFAERIVVKADLQLHIPEELSFESSCPLGVAVLTTGRCLFDKLGIDYPSIGHDGKFAPSTRSKQQILIYGGSSSMGTMLIQFAKLANFHVLTTSSSQNKELVTSYGADFVVDHYSQSATVELIEHAKTNEKTMGALRFCVDCVGTPGSPQFCAQVLHKDLNLDILKPNEAFETQLREAHKFLQIEGGEHEKIYSTIVPFSPPLPGITTVATLGYSFLGEPWSQGDNKFPANMKDFQDASRFAEIAEVLLKEGKIRPHPADLRKGGLQGIIDEGLPELKAKQVSGKKLVYPL